MATIGDIVIGLRMNHTQFSAGAQSARQELGGLGSLASAVGGKMLGFAAAATAGLTVIGAAKWGIEVAAQSEMAQASFSTLLGSSSKAKAMLVELTGYAAKTPYSQAGVRDAAQLLLNFGVNAKQVMPDLRMLGDVAMGSEEKLSRISLAYGQIASTGRLMGQDLNQLINAGFNPLQEISQRTGESMSDLKKRMEAGQIPFSEVRQAFEDATAAGGRFDGMAAKQSTTLTGLWSTLKDEIGLTLGKIAEEMMNAFDVKSLMGDAISFVSGLRSTITDLAPALQVVGAVARIAFDALMLPLRAIYETLGAMKEGYLWITNQPKPEVDAAAAGNEEFTRNGRTIRQREEKQAAIRDKNRNDPFGFAGIGDDMKKWTAALDKHSEVMGKSLEKQNQNRENNGLHGGVGGIFFDEKGGDYVAGAGSLAADAAQKKKDWETKWRAEKPAAQKSVGFVRAGSAEFFKQLAVAGQQTMVDQQLAAMKKQADEAKRGADEVAGMRRDFRDNQIAAVGVR